MNPDTVAGFEDSFDEITNRMKEIMLEKRALRGTGNIQRQGLMGVVTRIAEDKMSRIQREAEDIYLYKKLMEREVPVATVNKYITNVESVESLEDDLLDVANYAIIAIMLIRGTWEK